MSKIANGNVVYSGWLVKSPPENKFRLSGPWKIFRSVSEEGIQYVLSFDVYIGIYLKLDSLQVNWRQDCANLWCHNPFDP